jgi:hypothetical protein
MDGLQHLLASSPHSPSYRVLVVISVNANLKVDLETKERAKRLLRQLVSMADMLIYLLQVAGAFCTTILGPSTNVVDILGISRSGTTKWQRWGAPFILALRGAVEQYLQIEDLLTRGDEYLIAYKDSYVYECNMIAVAVSSPLLYSNTFPAGRHPDQLA